jgi:hypothetical protein
MVEESTLLTFVVTVLNMVSCYCYIINCIYIILNVYVRYATTSASKFILHSTIRNKSVTWYYVWHSALQYNALNAEGLPVQTETEVGFPRA